jgi:hypothetical protein
MLQVVLNLNMTGYRYNDINKDITLYAVAMWEPNKMLYCIHNFIAKSEVFYVYTTMSLQQNIRYFTVLTIY